MDTSEPFTVEPGATASRAEAESGDLLSKGIQRQNQASHFALRCNVTVKLNSVQRGVALAGIDKEVLELCYVRL
jgi:hypothetical protein